MPSILVTDGEQRSALATVRSLGRAGHTVYVASARPASLAGSSRYVRDTAVLPDPLQSPDAFVRGVIALIERWDVDLLLPVTEAALLALLPMRECIAAVLPFPSTEAFVRLCNKSVVAAEAQELGIGVPRTVLLEDRGAAANSYEETLPYPLVLKPHRSVTSGRSRRKVGVYRVANRRELDAALNSVPDNAFPVLLQEQIAGPGVGIFVLMVDGEVRAAFAHRRIREKPPWGGVSVFRESIPLDEELLARSTGLLQRFEFVGAAMVEYKIDARTQMPYIMEINGRFWGSLQLAIDAGVDFPALLVDAFLHGKTKVASRAYRSVRSRWFWGDVDSLLLRLQAASGVDGRVMHSRIDACMDFLRAFGPKNRSEIFRLSDPKPALRETLDWFAALRSARSL